MMKGSRGGYGFEIVVSMGKFQRGVDMCIWSE